MRCKYHGCQARPLHAAVQSTPQWHRPWRRLAPQCRHRRALRAPKSRSSLCVRRSSRLLHRRSNRFQWGPPISLRTIPILCYSILFNCALLIVIMWFDSRSSCFVWLIRMPKRIPNSFITRQKSASTFNFLFHEEERLASVKKRIINVMRKALFMAGVGTHSDGNIFAEGSWNSWSSHSTNKTHFSQ